MAIWRPELHTRYDAEIREAAARAGIDWLLLKALVAKESAFQPDAFRKEPEPVKAAGIPPSHAGRQGSYGLCQVLLSTVRADYGFRGHPDELFDPVVNLRYGADYLRRMLRAFDGDVRLALAAYNAGPGTVRKLQRQYGRSYDAIEPHLPQITVYYVRRALEYRREFEQYEKEKGGGSA